MRHDDSAPTEPGSYRGTSCRNGSQASAGWESHSGDNGKEWSKPQEISGSNPAICTFQTASKAGVCDENQFSVPTVAPDGTVYVAFENSQNQSLNSPGEVNQDQYLLVKSTNGGKKWSNPSFVVGLEDGSRDYPLNVDRRQTLTGYQVRVDSAGPVVPVGRHQPADRQDRRPLPRPRRVERPDLADGDRRGCAGSLVKTTVSTAASHPTMSEFFQAGAPGCELCATFHGDYITVG